MSNDFEDRLRAALRPVDPEPGFAERIALRASRAEKPPGQPARWKFPALPAALAAGLALMALGALHWQEHRERQGLEARRQLLEALQVTGEKLDLAYEVVNAGSRSNGESPGA